MQPLCGWPASAPSHHVIVRPLPTDGARATTRLQSIGQFLSGVTCLQGVAAAALERLAACVEEVRVEAGQLLAREGELGCQVFIVVEGIATVTVRSEPVARVGPAECFGAGAVLGRRPRSATVRAATPMLLLTVGSEEFAELMSTRA